MKKKPTESVFCDNKINFFKTLFWGFIFSFVTISCTKKEAETPTPIVKVEEPKYLEWSYEVGKDPLPIQIFTFQSGNLPVIDTLKIENIFNGFVSGIDYTGNFRNLDMTKNSWNNQIFPGISVKVGGYEFSKEIKDELFKGVLLTNISGNIITDWARQNLTKIYNEKLKPILDKKNAAYFKLHNKKPKYQVITLIIPNENYESGGGGTVITMSDGNIVTLGIEKSNNKYGAGVKLPNYIAIDNYISFYTVLGHEFAGHAMTEGLDFKNYVGQKDQLGNTVDVSGHINSDFPRCVFNSSTATFLWNDKNSNTMIFPEPNKEFYSAYDGGEFEEAKYGNLKLMKTPAEISNIPYIADMVKIKKERGEKWMKDMWTDKILLPKGGRIATKADYVTIKSIVSCN
jgi:hypothetical protein